MNHSLKLGFPSSSARLIALSTVLFAAGLAATAPVMAAGVFGQCSAVSKGRLWVATSPASQSSVEACRVAILRCTQDPSAMVTYSTNVKFFAAPLTTCGQ